MYLGLLETYCLREMGDSLVTLTLLICGAEISLVVSVTGANNRSGSECSTSLLPFVSSLAGIGVDRITVLSVYVL